MSVFNLFQVSWETESQSLFSHDQKILFKHNFMKYFLLVLKNNLIKYLNCQKAGKTSTLTKQTKKKIAKITKKVKPFLKSFLLENMNSYGKYKQIMCILQGLLRCKAKATFSHIVDFISPVFFLCKYYMARVRISSRKK